jgi:hypothetical protein
VDGALELTGLARAVVVGDLEVVGLVVSNKASVLPVLDGITSLWEKK